jgi:hypothetical protein
MKDQEKEFAPSSWAIDNKTAVYVLIILISLLGLISYMRLQRKTSRILHSQKFTLPRSIWGNLPKISRCWLQSSWKSN